MKYFNQAIKLDINDFDFGDHSNNFRILDSGIKKIQTYYKWDTNGNFYEQIKTKAKITGSKLLSFSGSKDVNEEVNNPFAKSSLLTILEMIGIIKDSVDNIYVDTGNYYENTIRNSLNEHFKIKKWITFKLFKDNELFNSMYIDNYFVPQNIPLVKMANKGNIFKVPALKIKYHDTIYHIDFSIFGGMPDGYAIYEPNTPNLFRLVECKTKTFNKFENNVTKDEFNENNYEPIIIKANRVYIQTTNKNTGFKTYEFVKQYDSENENVVEALNVISEDENTKKEYVVLNGYFGKYKTNNQQIYVDETKRKKQFDSENHFKVNDISYYAQASLYSLLIYLSENEKFKNTNEIIELTDQELSQLNVMFAMGLISAFNYVKPTIKINKQTIQNDLVLYTKDGNFKLKQADWVYFFKIDNVYYELYNINTFVVKNKYSKYASNSNLNNGTLNLISLLADCTSKYHEFFLENKGISLNEPNNKKTALMLKNYLFNLYNKTYDTNISNIVDANNLKH